MASAKREKAEALLEALPALSKAIGEGKCTDLPLKGGARLASDPSQISPRSTRTQPPPPTRLVRARPTHPPSPPSLASAEHFYCNNFPEFVARVKSARASVAALLHRLGVDGAADATADPDAATRVDEDDDFCRGVVSSIDDHLDRIDHDLDAIAAARRDGADASATAAASPASRTTADAAPREPPPPSEERCHFTSARSPGRKTRSKSRWITATSRTIHPRRGTIPIPSVTSPSRGSIP